MGWERDCEESSEGMKYLSESTHVRDKMQSRGKINVHERIMNTDEKLDRLTGIVETLAGAVTAHDSVIEAHDRQIGALITLAEKNQAAMAQLQRK